MKTLIISMLILKSGVLYSRETWRITERNQQRLENRYTETIRVSRLDIKRNEKIKNNKTNKYYGRINYPKIELKHLIWYRNLERMSKESLP